MRMEAEWSSLVEKTWWINTRSMHKEHMGVYLFDNLNLLNASVALLCPVYISCCTYDQSLFPEAKAGMIESREVW